MVCIVYLTLHHITPHALQRNLCTTGQKSIAKELLRANQVVFIERVGLCTEVKIHSKGAFGTQPSDLYREAVSVQRSKSTAKELSGPNKVVFIERWSHNTYRWAL